MSTWMHAAGDTERFAVRLTLEHDPDKQAFDDPAHGGSWGSLQVWVDGLNVTAWRAPEGDGDAVRWHLLPLLEWVARAWVPLLHEERLPLGLGLVHATAADAMVRQPPVDLGLDTARYYDQLGEWQRWHRDHALTTAAQGGVFPRLYLRRWGDLVEASWRSEDLVGTPGGLRFLVPAGAAHVAVAEVAGVLRRVLSEAVAELSGRHPASRRLGLLREALASLPERTRAEAPGWLLPSERVWEQVRQRFPEAAAEAQETLSRGDADDVVLDETPQLAVLFGSIDPAVALDDVDRLTRLAVEARTANPSTVPDLGDHREEVERAGLPAFEQGNRLAEDVAAHFDLPTDQPVDPLALLDGLGVSTARVALSDARVRAVTLLGAEDRALCAFNDTAHLGRSPEVVRFSAAHELCHLLFDRYRARRLAVASGPWAPRALERRANAFAAALLMPRDLLDQAAARSDMRYGSAGWIRQIAATAQTSVRATLERLGNLGLLDEETREALRDELRSPG